MIGVTRAGPDGCRAVVAPDERFVQEGHVEALARDPGHDDLRMRTHLAGCPACAEEADGLLSLLTVGLVTARIAECFSSDP